MPHRRHRQDDYEGWKNRFNRPGEEEPYDYVGSPNPKRLYRSTSDRVIAGVCGGIAERFGWEPTLVRVFTVAAFFFFAGPLMILAYILMWIITPKRPRSARPLSKDEETFWRGVSDRPQVTFSNLRYKFMDLEDRLQGLESSVTSNEWRLRKQFRDLERG
ncbi:envelope stress response membrane protein PspC [Ponticaulis profundi]|uniref:Envelope stress response membrane protein PspC n=1 Tax=Ponticaulis profundi TaxID=2665222 RepID=A0ABW1S8Z3_9PROT